VKAQEQWAVTTMSDDLLAEHLARLRRMLVMADEDGSPDYLVDLTRERFTMAQRETTWRKRAEEKGGPVVERSREARDRVERLKREVNLAMLLAYECEGARPSGLGKWVCCCPFHPDRTPSLSIDVAKGLWYCHGCHVGGDCITYAELRYGLDFAGALRHLEQRL